MTGTGAPGRKAFILDTNVLIYDPECLRRFEENDVVIPMLVIEELDNLKRSGDEEVRYAAREAGRQLDEITSRVSCEDDITRGIPLGEGLGSLFIDSEEVQQTVNLDISSPGKSVDNSLVQIAKKYQSRGATVEVVTQDTNVRVKCRTFGVPVSEYRAQRRTGLKLEDLVGIHREVEVSPDVIEEMYAKGRGRREEGAVRVPEIERMLAAEQPPKLFMNQYLLLRDMLQPDHTAIVMYVENGTARLAPDFGKELLGTVRTRNLEQRFAASMLLDDRIRFGVIIGKAGTGKTLLALAAAIQQVNATDSAFTEVIGVRPTVTLESPFMTPFFDALGYIFNAGKSKGRKTERPWEGMMQKGILSFDTVTYYRGRSIHGAYVIIDDAQNLTRWQVDSIITRVAEDSKIVLLGDPYQIDDRFLTAETCGITYAAKILLGDQAAGVVHLRKPERNPAIARIVERIRQYRG
jgi:PhoH-like ATPase